MDELRTLSIRFNTPIARWELPLFRGAIVSLLSRDNIIYHNHRIDGLRYGYPLIQYKRIAGQAALICVGDGVDAVEDLLGAERLEVRIGDRHEMLQIEHINASRHMVEMIETPMIYQLSDWLPLNGKNHKLYEQEEGLVARISMLERILTGNILSMLKGVGIFISSRLQTEIIALRGVRLERFKNVSLQALDIQFKGNLSLPDDIGLGRHASVGFGTLTRIRNKQKT